jgi:hypothetical protein
MLLASPVMHMEKSSMLYPSLKQILTNSFMNYSVLASLTLKTSTWHNLVASHSD